MNRLVLFCFLFFLTLLSHATSLVKRCVIDEKSNTSISILREKNIGNTYIYYIQRNKDEKELLYSDQYASRGSQVKIQCAGRRNRFLIITGEFSSNYLQGAAITNNGDFIDKFYFAERNLPIFLYSNGLTTLLIFSGKSQGEIPNKFVIYKHKTGDQREAEIYGLDKLPAKANFEVTHFHRTSCGRC
jgi:hypothetical protein